MVLPLNYRLRNLFHHLYFYNNFYNFRYFFCDTRDNHCIESSFFLENILENFCYKYFLMHHSEVFFLNEDHARYVLKLIFLIFKSYSGISAELNLSINSGVFKNHLDEELLKYVHVVILFSGIQLSQHML